VPRALPHKGASSPGRRPRTGSARDPLAQAAILDAVRKLLAERGYAGVTVEAVAQHAGVGKATIYRWWSGKVALVYEAIWSPGPIPPDSGDLEADLRAYVRRVIDFLSRRDVTAALTGLVSDTFSAAENVSIVNEYARESAGHIKGLLARGVESGEIRSDVDAATIVDMMIGTVLSRVLAQSMGRLHRPARRDKEEFAEQVLSLLLLGIRNRDR
jgi:AcrR family transcriptional regulator